MPRDNGASAERARRLQVVVEGDDRGATKRMADRLGIDYARWHNVVGRDFAIGIDVAQRIVARIPGVSLDWLYNGEPAGLSYRMAKELGISGR
jgi:hypothetical protein